MHDSEEVKVKVMLKRAYQFECDRETWAAGKESKRELSARNFMLINKSIRLSLFTSHCPHNKNDKKPQTQCINPLFMRVTTWVMMVMTNVSRDSFYPKTVQHRYWIIACSDALTVHTCIIPNNITRWPSPVLLRPGAYRTKWANDMQRHLRLPNSNELFISKA